MGYRLKILLYILLAQVVLIFSAMAFQFEPKLFEQTNADTIFDQAEKVITLETKNIHVLENMIDELEKIKINSDICIEKSTKQINIINDLIKERLGERYTEINGETVKYINDKKKYYSDYMSKCTLYQLKSQDAIYAINNIINKVGTKTLVRRSTPIYKAINLNYKGIISTIDITKIPSTSIILMIAIVLIYPFVFSGLKFCRLRSKFLCFKSINKSNKSRPYRNIQVLISILLLSFLILLFFKGQNLPKEIIDIGLGLFYIALLLLVGNIITSLSQHLKYKHKIITISSTIIIGALTISLVFMGYHALMKYIISGIALSLLAFIALAASFQILHGRQRYFLKHSEYIKEKFRKITGLEKNETPTEVLLIKTCIYVFLVVLFSYTLLTIWVTSDNFINQTQTAIIDGFKIFDVKFNFFRIFISVLSFSGLLFTTRIISEYISKKQQSTTEAKRQVAIASIVMYSGFVISLVISLLLAGITFTGLAIIIGALSVGIGLGLQNIVNNFVSGILLLIEKPIKSGDRVLINDTEGHVKNIGIRSTRVVTLAKEDVIIPNADLMTHQVTNYMFKNQLWRVICKVGVKYGSDTKLVKNVLLDVANNHPDVIQEAPNQPVVLFQEFGNSSLAFELWCIIRDVNKKYHTASELRFAIDNAFRKNDITIAFPQRDIHVKEYPLIPIDQSSQEAYKSK